MEIKSLVQFFYTNIDLQQVWKKLKRHSTSSPDGCPPTKE